MSIMDHVPLFDKMLPQRQHSDYSGSRRSSLPVHHVPHIEMPPRSATFSASQTSSSARPPPTKARSYPPTLNRGQQGRVMDSRSQAAGAFVDVHSSAHALLTPSGRALAVGGRMRDVSFGSSEPCFVFWPDNEPLPDPGQIRPPNYSGPNQPPILNTGNRGPICHQPGDWICRQCNYLNWRRRIVCKTCFPYTEGNGDAVSVSMNAAKSAILSSVINQPAQCNPVDDSFGHTCTTTNSPRLSSHRRRSDSADKISGGSHTSKSYVDSNTFNLERLSINTRSQIYETSYRDSGVALSPTLLSSTSMPHQRSPRSNHHVVYLSSPTSPVHARFVGDSYTTPSSHSEQSSPLSSSFVQTPLDREHQLPFGTPRHVDYPAPSIWRFSHQDRDLLSTFPPVPTNKDFESRWPKSLTQVQTKG